MSEFLFNLSGRLRKKKQSKDEKYCEQCRKKGCCKEEPEPEPEPEPVLSEEQKWEHLVQQINEPGR